MPGAFQAMASMGIGNATGHGNLAAGSLLIPDDLNGEIYRAFADVITGIRDSASVQITNGLKAGDTIITTGLMGLKPKGKVILNIVKSEK